MALIRWQPFGEVDTLRREMDRLFDSFLTPPRQVDGGEKGLSFVPAAEMTETPEAIELKLEIPGLEAKDLDIEVTADSVTISGERKSESKTEEEGYTRTEFHYGQFRRVIPLSANIDNTNVIAEYKDGILNINLPKVEAEKNKVVKVNIA